LDKIKFSSTSSHEELQKTVDEYELPALYGGVCECKATCIYSEKGPWTEVENMIDYRNPDAVSDSDSDNGESLGNFLPMKKK